MQQHFNMEPLLLDASLSQLIRLFMRAIEDNCPFERTNYSPKGALQILLKRCNDQMTRSMGAAPVLQVDDQVMFSEGVVLSRV